MYNIKNSLFSSIIIVDVIIINEWGVRQHDLLSLTHHVYGGV